MNASEQPTGHVTAPDAAAVDAVEHDGRLDRWLRPGERRPVAALLLLAAAAMNFLVTGHAASGLPFTPGGYIAVIQLLPVITSAAVMGGIAAFVLAGSPAARVLGGLAATGGLLQLLVPLIAYGLPLNEANCIVVLQGISAFLHAATIVAVALPPGSVDRTTPEPRGTGGP